MLTLSAFDLQRVIDSVVHAAAPPDSHFPYQGVRLEVRGDQLRMVATDGAQLAWAEAPCVGAFEMPKSRLLSSIDLRRAAAGLSAGEAVITSQSDGMIISVAGKIYKVEYVIGEFPRYRDVTEHLSPLQARIERCSCLRALSRLRDLSTTPGREGLLRFSSGCLTITMDGPDKRKAEIVLPIQYVGNDVTISLNFKKLAALVSYGADVLDVRFGKTIDNPVFILGRDDYMGVLMPRSLD